MAFATIEDGTGKIEVVVFPRTYEITRALWTKDQLVLVEGRLDKREERLNLLVENAMPFSEKTQLKKDFDFSIEIPRGISSRKLVTINKLLKSSPGKMKGVLFFEGEGGRKRLVLTFGVNYTKELEREIKKIIKG